MMRLGARRTDGEVVVQSSDWPGVVRENPLGCQEWVECLHWSALQRQRSPLDWRDGSDGFTLDGERSGAVLDCLVEAGLSLHSLSMLSNWTGMCGMMGAMWGMMSTVCGMLRLSMMSPMVGSMFSMVLAVLGMVGVVMIVTISHDQRHHH